MRPKKISANKVYDEARYSLVATYATFMHPVTDSQEQHWSCLDNSEMQKGKNNIMNIQRKVHGCVFVKYRYMMYDIWIYELVFCATCCVVVRWQEAPNTICTALHHFSARSKCSSRPNSHQKVLKRNRQKPEKKGTQWWFSYIFSNL